MTIYLKDICLSIPIFTNETRQFKKVLVNSVTGGLLQRESAEITRINALKNVNCNIERGERIAPITIDMALTQKCSYACTFCYAGLQQNPAAPVENPAQPVL